MPQKRCRPEEIIAAVR